MGEDAALLLAVGDFANVRDAEVEDLFPAELLARELDRMYRTPDVPFAETYRPGAAIVPPDGSLGPRAQGRTRPRLEGRTREASERRHSFDRARPRSRRITSTAGLAFSPRSRSRRTTTGSRRRRRLGANRVRSFESRTRVRSRFCSCGDPGWLGQHEDEKEIAFHQLEEAFPRFRLKRILQFLYIRKSYTQAIERLAKSFGGAEWLATDPYEGERKQRK